MIPVRYRQLQIALAAWRRSARDLDLEGYLEGLRRILADFSELLPDPRSPAPRRRGEMSSVSITKSSQGASLRCCRARGGVDRGSQSKLNVTIACAPARMAAASTLTIVDVGKNERVDEPLEVGHHAVGHSLRHQLARALEGLRLFQVGTVLEDVPKALVENRRRPSRAHDAGVGQAYEQVTKRCRIEHACVVEDDERHSNLVAEAVLPLLRR